MKLTIITFLSMFIFAGNSFAAQNLPPRMALVAKLYKNFAFEAVIEEPNVGGDFLNSPRGVLLSSLTPNLANLILKDAQCKTETKEICKIDFMPLWDSQDPIGTSVQLLPERASDTVKVQLSQGSEMRTLTFFFTLTNNGWRIKDIAYENGQRSLLEMLSGTK